MVKIIRLLSLLVISISFVFASYEAQLNEFDSSYKSATKRQMIKYHKSLKGIYIKSIMNSNDRLKIEALKRLVVTSSRLGLSSKAYKKELLTLQKLYKNRGIVRKSDIKKLAQKVPSIKSSKKKTKRKLKDYKTPVKGSKSKIVKVKSYLKGITLSFNTSVKKVDVRAFALKGRKYYRYVFDIGSILAIKSQKIYLKDMGKVRVSQFDKKTVRVVFESKKRMKIFHTKIDNKINIGYDKVKKSKRNSSNAIASTKVSNYKSRRNKVIVVDAGHGGKDGGAQGGSGRLEKKVVLQTALRIGKELKKRGFKVYYTRVKDKFIQLRNRTKMANKKNADLFISIHANAAPTKSKYKKMHGVETFFLSPAKSNRSKNVAAQENKSDLAEMNYFSKQTYLNFLNREKILASNKLAIDIQRGMLSSVRKKYKVRDGGVREAPFWVLVGAQMPAVLVEIGYITNPIEGRRISSGSYQTLLAKGIVSGIVGYFDKNP